MKISQAIIAAGAAVVVGVGGGVAAAQVGDDGSARASGTTPGGPSASPAASPSTSPRATPTASRTAAASPTGGASTATPAATPVSSTPATASAPVDRLSAENLVRERLYYDVTGHSFSAVPLQQVSNERLGACTGDATYTDFLPRKGLTQREAILAGSDVLRMTELMAQTRSAGTARSAARAIVDRVERCPGVPGGDFGYGDPVTVRSDASGEVVYFPGYDSDRRFGGYVVFSAGNRVGVIDVADKVRPRVVAHLAQEAAGIADD